jgi:hypothetical protein
MWTQTWTRSQARVTRRAGRLSGQELRLLRALLQEREIDEVRGRLPLSALFGGASW